MQEFNRVASSVEDYLNADLAKQPNHTVNSYASYSVAAAIREDNDLVHDVIHATDAGANGITIFKGDYEKAMAAVGSPPPDETEEVPHRG